MVMASHKHGEMDIARALLLSGISETYAQSHASIKIPHPSPGKQDAVSHHDCTIDPSRKTGLTNPWLRSGQGSIP
jgi:hypothetical protein